MPTFQHLRILSISKKSPDSVQLRENRSSESEGTSDYVSEHNVYVEDLASSEVTRNDHVTLQRVRKTRAETHGAQLRCPWVLVEVSVEPAIGVIRVLAASSAHGHGPRSPARPRLPSASEHQDRVAVRCIPHDAADPNLARSRFPPR